MNLPPDQICGYLHSTGTERWICVKAPHEDDGPEIPHERNAPPIPLNPTRHHYIAVERYREEHPDV